MVRLALFLFFSSVVVTFASDDLVRFTQVRLFVDQPEAVTYPEIPIVGGPLIEENSSVKPVFVEEMKISQVSLFSEDESEPEVVAPSVTSSPMVDKKTDSSVSDDSPKESEVPSKLGSVAVPEKAVRLEVAPDPASPVLVAPGRSVSESGVFYPPTGFGIQPGVSEQDTPAQIESGMDVESETSVRIERAIAVDASASPARVPKVDAGAAPSRVEAPSYYSDLEAGAVLDAAGSGIKEGGSTSAFSPPKLGTLW